MDKKIKELAEKYEIPEALFKEALALEKGKDVLQNRRLSPKIVQLIERHTDTSR